MKKILGISLVSVLAVSPMMAHATDVTIIESVTGNALTTQAYVKGAYNDLAGHINTKADKTALETEATARANADTAINNKIGSVDYEGASLTAAIADLQTSASNLGSGKVNSAGNFTAETDSALIKNKTVENAIKDTAAQVDINTGAIATKAAQADLTAETTARTNADTAINTKIGAGDISVREATTVVGALNELNTDLGTAESAIRTLNGDANTAGSVAAAVAAEADRATTAETGLGNRITTLETANSALSGTYATKTGVDNAIEKAAYTTTLTASTVTGTVSVPTSASISVASSWTDDTPASAPVTLTNGTVSLVDGRVATSTITTSANADYATANPATPANP